MATLDSEPERQRLAKLYAGMSEGELGKIAQDGPELTEAAREALRRELAKRGLAVEVADPPAGYDEVELQEWVMIRRFRDLPEALLAKGALESAGIECQLTDDNMVRLDWFISNLVGGAKLQVKPEEAEAARAVLDQPIPENFEVEGAGEYQQPDCPKCHSVNVTYEGLNKPLAYATAYVGVPLPIRRDSWKCESCGCRWKESEETND
jgi:putative signal transducing protein